MENVVKHMGNALSVPVQEGYRALGVSVRTGADLVKSGKLKTFLIGARRYVTTQELQRFIKRRIRESAAADTPEARLRRVEDALAARRTKQRSVVEA
jgi:hypothetical protein